jgi:ribosomal protein L29
MDGLASLGCDSIPKLRKKLPELRRELANERMFKV